MKRFFCKVLLTVLCGVVQVNITLWFAILAFLLSFSLSLSRGEILYIALHSYLCWLKAHCYIHTTPQREKSRERKKKSGINSFAQNEFDWLIDCQINFILHIFFLNIWFFFNEFWKANVVAIFWFSLLVVQ